MIIFPQLKVRAKYFLFIETRSFENDELDKNSIVFFP